VNAAILAAIQNHSRLQLVYDWGNRIVEPHAYGVGAEGQELLRAYQTTGVSQSGESRGWKLFRLDEIESIHVLRETFARPRPGYRPNDRAMSHIYAQL